jgi:hypothetical protein
MGIISSKWFQSFKTEASMVPGSSLYTPSPQLRQAIAAVEVQVSRRLRRPIALIEYITLPDFGQHLILRFETNPPLKDLATFDALENQLRDIVGKDFWANLGNTIYPPQFLAELPQRLEALTPLVASIPMPVSSSKYVDHIQNDARIIRTALQDSSLKIWEIEIPWQAGELPVLRVVGETKLRPTSAMIEGQEYLIEVHPPNNSYVNLVKAYTLAVQAGVSLSHFIFGE